MKRRPQRNSVRLAIAGAWLAVIVLALVVALADEPRECFQPWLKQAWDSEGRQVPTHSEVCVRNGEVISWTCGDDPIIVQDGWPTCPLRL